MLLITAIAVAQSRKTFKDSLFYKGDLIRIPEIRFLLGLDNGLNNDSLQVISNFINAHKNMIVEIGSHTDSRGNANNNYTLSLARARSIKDVLVKDFGVDPTRVTAKGYGVTKPIVPAKEILEVKTAEEKEQLHAINRRTELKVLSVVKDTSCWHFLPGEIIKIPEIIYGTSNARITETEDSLKPVAAFINGHKKLVLELGCHTDSRGDSAGNLKLADLRALTAYYYLVKVLKVNPDQLSYKGYGERELIIPDEEIRQAKTQLEKERLHARNRRTELKVLDVVMRRPVAPPPQSPSH